jgi:hypothetical protein
MTHVFIFQHLNYATATIHILLLLQEQQLRDDHIHKKSKFNVQTSMKQNCCAKITIREIVKYPKFEVKMSTVVVILVAAAYACEVFFVSNDSIIYHHYFRTRGT